MYEIELKAHVHDRGALLAKLRSFAEYMQSADKDDTYFQLKPGGGRKDRVTVRLRRESIRDRNGEKENLLLTYKKKELKVSDGGAALEVNDEKECSVSSAEPIETLLADIGFTESAKKRKITEAYRVWTDCGEVLLELCTVPPLGDFLEIETLCETEENTDKIRAELEKLLDKCGLSSRDIEPRYYSEMLREHA